MTVNEQKLYGTTDAMVWAEEFMGEFGDRREDIDVGLMVGWFANAMNVAEMRESGRIQADRVAIRRALNELGVPGPGYPAPVANAVEILTGALGD